MSDQGWLHRSPFGSSLFSYVQRWAWRAPDALAIEYESQTCTYGELVVSVQERSQALRRRGVGVGDRVAWLGPNHPAALELLLACSELGAMLLPLNARLAVPEHTWILDDAEPQLLMCEASFADHGEAAVAACQTEIPLEIEPGFGELNYGKLSLGDPANSDITDTSAGGAEHAVLLAYTSGTTGHPKGAVLTQAALAANAVNSTHAHNLTSQDRVLTVIPLFHVGGLNIQTLPALLSGAAVLIHRGFDPGLFLEDVARWQPTWTVLVPATLLAVAAHPNFEQTDLGSLKGIMTGSSPVPLTTTQPFFARGVGVGEVYGATETAPICVHIRPDEAAAHPGSCGKPSTLCEIKLVPLDEAEPATSPATSSTAAGESGEIWVRGPNVFREYWRNPEATRSALVDGWYRTGDIAHSDSEGWLYIDDRLGDVIISGGENIYPAEIEEHLVSCPAVAEAAVIGRADERWGEVPVVIAVANSTDQQTPEAAAVLDYLRGRIARFKIPADVIWTEALPRTALGKVQKNVLRERFSHELSGK